MNECELSLEEDELLIRCIIYCHGIIKLKGKLMTQDNMM